MTTRASLWGSGALVLFLGWQLGCPTFSGGSEPLLTPFAPRLCDDPACCWPLGGCTLCASSLLRMSPCELNKIYMTGHPGPVPSGFYPGTPIMYAGTHLALPVSNMVGSLWKGKVICRDEEIMRNLVGKRLVVPAAIYPAESWLDGKPALIMDYQGMGTRWADRGRDEIRQIAPHLYLGITYIRDNPQPRIWTYFVLEEPCCNPYGHF